MTDQSPPQHADLEGLLGELELAIMQVVWARGEVAVRDVWDVLHPTRALAYTTVMTVMSIVTASAVHHRLSVRMTQLLDRPLKDRLSGSVSR